MGREEVVIIFTHDFGFGLKSEPFEKAAICGYNPRGGVFRKKRDSRQFGKKALEASAWVDFFEQRCAVVEHGGGLWGFIGRNRVWSGWEGRVFNLLGAWI